MACSTTMALRSEAWVITSRGLRPDAASFTASRPEASAARMRSAWVAGIVPVWGRAMPRASTRQPMVEAVPMTMQVPTVGARRCDTASISASSILPARCMAQRRRQSVQAPSTSPL